MSGRLTRALVALLVLVSGIGVGGVAAAETPEPAIEVSLSTVDVYPGDTLTIELEGPNLNTATIDRVVPYDGSTDEFMFWISSSELSDAGLSTSELEGGDVSMYSAVSVSSDSATTIDPIVDLYYAEDTLSERVTVADGDAEIVTNYTANSTDVVLELYNATSGAHVETIVDTTNATAGETITSTVDATALEPGDYVIRPVAPAVGDQLTVGVFDEAAGGGGVGGDGSGQTSDTTLYVLGAVAVVGLLLVMRE